MKTLNSILRTILLTLALVSTFTTQAYNMYVNGVYYNIIDDDKAAVTYISYSSYYYVGNTQYSLYGVNCYNYNNKYKNNVTIPETVTYDGTTYTVTSIENYAFANCYTLTDVSIPNTVTSIGHYAFYNCSELKDITIPNFIISISDYAFAGCSSLSHITIPNSVTTIGDQAFSNCSSLATITIGNSVTSIGSSAFNACPLSSITSLAMTPPSASGFPNTSTAKLYVPKESVELYRTSSGWNYFKNVYGFGNDSFSIPDETSFHGDTIVIPVSMQNESTITAFQTDVYLPNGFELVDVNGEYQVSLSDRKGRDHVIMVNDAPDGALRVLSYSPTLKAFKNNEGELFYITVKVPEGVSGTFPIWLRNTILTSTDEEELYAIDALSNVNVTSIIMGDVNNSGTITAADIVLTAKYILYQNPEPFVFEAADMNGDSKITVTDVVKIANLILDQDYEEPTTLRSTASNPVSDRMSGETVGNTVCINLDNEMEYTALQLDLTLPEGMTASDFALTERASSLGLSMKDKGNGKIRVLAYTPILKTIKGSEGTFLTFNMDGQMGDIKVDRIEVVNLNGESTHLQGFTINANNPTVLNEMTTGKTISSVNYFNLAGQQMTEPASGVTIIVTTYSDGSRSTSKVVR